MAVHDMPVDALERENIICEKQEHFFSTTFREINSDDIVIMWVGSKDENRLNAYSNLKCRKVIKNVDSCSSDRVLFKREIELYSRLGLEGLLVTYCTQENMKFLCSIS